MPRRFIRRLPAPLLLALLVGCNDPADTDANTDKVAERAEQTAPDSAALVEQYRQTLDDLLAALNDDNPDRAESFARALIDQSLPLLDSVSLRYTECDAYLDAVRELPNQLRTLDAQAIQNGYVQGRALPDGAARCHDAAGLLTAPALATAVTRDPPEDWQATVRGHAQTARARLDGLRDVLSAEGEAAPDRAPR
ncbi:hypothetical protein A167_00875 [Alcanivorax sp. S71-1-4]|jgi:hypothetical protein|uniref:hypothetical protein n=1 Tax=Alcanivorax sp. S71-1-4 TaxID=1177159 RepID=UPI001357AD66|nr:hypothetical protein [Alcanivorax sp. S71-1-4]KAF0810194.1 hypothetical protein A167_00875 [Alcanivorax sp. S71-1-4]